MDAAARIPDDRYRQDRNGQDQGTDIDGDGARRSGRHLVVNGRSRTKPLVAAAAGKAPILPALEGTSSSISGRSGRPLLAVSQLDHSYGDLQILFSVNIHVATGEVLALLGTNGAGKSTLLRVVSGLTPPTSGTVEFAGEDITGLGPVARVERGIVQVPGGRAVFRDLTVDENLRLGGILLRKDPALLRERRDMVLDLFPVLRTRLRQRAATLSGGEQQMLGVAKGVLLRPRLLCIDELSLGLAPAVVQELLGVIEELRRDGTTIVIVEQSVNVALSLADRAVFMEKGHVRFEGQASDLLERDDLVRAVFLGGGDS